MKYQILHLENKNIIKADLKSYLVGKNMQQSLLYSSAGQEDFLNHGKVSEFPRKESINFLFFLKVSMDCGKGHPGLFLKLFISLLFVLRLPNTLYIF